MRHIKELLEHKPKIGEVDTCASDYQAHRSLRAMAASIGAPAVKLATLKVPDEQSTSRIDTVSGWLAPQLAQWILDEELDMVISPEWLTTRRNHRVAGSAIMRAVVYATNKREKLLADDPTVTEWDSSIEILTGHGTVLVPGEWRVESDLVIGPIPDGPAPSYSRHLVNPGVITSGSTEWIFGLPQED